MKKNKLCLVTLLDLKEFFSRINTSPRAGRAKLTLALGIGLLSFLLPVSNADALQGNNASALVVTGDLAPGTNGDTFGFIGSPVLNNVGDFAFTATLNGGGRGIWRWSNGSLESIAISGQNISGLENISFVNTPARLSIDDLGQVGFSATLSSTGSLSGNTGLFLATPTSTQVIALEGGAVPGADGDVRFGDFGVLSINTAFSHARNGQVAFDSSLTGSGTTNDNNVGFFSGTAGNISLVAREGDVAPNGELFALSSTGSRVESINTNGQIVFTAGLGGDTAVLTNSSSGLSIVAIEDTTPVGFDPGQEFFRLSGSEPSINSAGNIALGAEVFQPLNGQSGVFVGADNPLSPQVQSGDTVSGDPSLVISRIDEAVINANDDFAFEGNLGSVFTSVNGDIQVFAVEDTEVVDRPGFTFNRIDQFVFNGNGSVAILSSLDGPTGAEFGGFSSVAERGLFVGNPDGTLDTVVVEGDEFELGDGDIRTVDGVFVTGFFHTGNEDGRASFFNETGDLATLLSFDDNTAAIVVFQTAAVPEPGSGMILLLGGLIYACRRKRS